MDRAIVYPGQLPQDTDILDTNLFALIGQAFQNQAVLGVNTVVSGLTCTPTAPASLVVNIGVGSIYQMQPTDGSAYGSLGTNSNNIVKQGILPVAQSLTITPPGTTGYSQVYLVQVQLVDTDTGAQVLNYYNSSNPGQPFSGPANSGQAQFTTRSCKCVVALKAGVPATTGTQAAPAPDSGFLGLYTITVPNGATQITTGNITLLATAPFFPTLPQVPYDVQGGVYNYAGQDTGTANAYVITFAAGQPQPAAYKAGMKVSFKAQNACTGASTVNVNGLGAVAIRRASGVALSANDIVSGGVVELTYDGTLFQMQNYLGAGATSNTTTVVNIPYVVDTGTPNAVIATFSPAITAGQQVAGLTIEVKLANTITGSATINVNGLGQRAIRTGDLQNPPNGLFVAGEVLLLVYDGTQYVVVNTTSLIYRKPSANTDIYVNATTGSDTIYDGTSATVVGGGSSAGPFATISKAVYAAFGYAPSQYTITIHVAPGVYAEAVSTPSFSGPNLVIDGGSAATTVISSGASTCIGVSGPNTMLVKNVTIQNSGNPNVANGFSASSGAVLTVQNTISNAVASAVFFAVNNATVVFSNHTFNGSSTFLGWANRNGVVQPGGTLTFGASISVSAGFSASQGGQVDMNFTPGAGPTFVNPSYLNGAKYSAALNGVVIAQSLGGVANLPGTTAGSTATGGQAL
ncbi:hypothetical protein ACRQ5Q_15230 [Bradyrhizobium sp. PMVTL-01]|uniref:hypothetical protein n=1 Tax=Bradyrhizobium sp. PMVTL-01 TaxID=3434999 RepID=UPI003F717B33